MATAEDDASPKSYDLNKILAEIDTFDFVKKLPESPAMEAQDTGPLIFLRLFAQLFAMQKHQKAKQLGAPRLHALTPDSTSLGSTNQLRGINSMV